MIIDCDAFLGHYPFRRLLHHDPDSMISLMDSNGIDRSVVTWLPSLFYRDVHSGNAELHEAVKKHKQRLVPIATINPKYVGWERDMAECVETWRMSGVALAPAYHGYRLTDEHGRAAIRRIEEYGVPLVLAQRFEDRRQRHAWDVAEDLEVKEVLETAKSFTQLKMLLCNWLGLDGDKLKQAGLRGRCLIDMARMHVILNKDIPKLIEQMGIESIVFGTHAPFDYVGPSLVKLANLESLPAEHYEKISWRNAYSFFNLT
ncbi:MAG: hypothetical protein ABL921_04965 [Pirellula sp.]